MKLLYKLLFLVVAIGIGTSSAVAQSVLVVEWADTNGDIIVNSLRDAIANDASRPDDRVYKLKRGGFYWNEDRIEVDGFHLRLIGETAAEADPSEAFVCGPGFDEDCGPAVVQRVHRTDGSIDGLMLNTSGAGSHLTLENVWLMGQTGDGVRTTWQPFRMNANDSRYVFDNVVFDRNDWQHLGNAGANTSLFVTNSHFRNLFGPAQQWEGMAMQFDAGADSVVIENNSFVNLGFTVVKSEAAPMDYFRVNHNTFVNVGRNFTSGAIFKEAYVTNNVFVNYFWHGEQPSEYEDPNRIDDFAGFFGIAALPSQFGTDLDRRIVLANNSFWRDDQIAASMPADIRAQPIVNDTTAGWFAAFDGMVMQNNFAGVGPDLGTYPSAIIPDMVANITELRGGSSDAARYYFDLGRDEGCFQCNVWPIGEDFSYTTASLLTGSTDGLPVGDLNWFPASKADFENNKDAYVLAIEDLAGARIELEIVGTDEADDGALSGATVEGVDGFTFYEMQSSGSIEWSFNLATAGTYDLSLGTRLAFGTKGQHLTIDGQRFKNQAFDGNGEFVFDAAVLGSDWVDYRITPDTVWVSNDANFAGPEVLTMDAGAHTFRIAPSWGFQHFSGFSFIDPVSGDTVASARAVDAAAEGVVPICDTAEWCPTGFKSVAVGAGGNVSWGMDFPATGTYVVRIFYDAPTGATARLVVNGVNTDPAVNLASGVNEVLTAQFAGTMGINTVALESDAGGFNVDFVQLIEVRGTGVGTEQNELPDGYALDQNYPNPFNPSTTISFTMAKAGDVRLDVFDITGRRVSTLVDNHVPAGTFNVTYDASEVGAVASGIYFYRLVTPVGRQARSMVLLK